MVGFAFGAILGVFISQLLSLDLFISLLWILIASVICIVAYFRPTKTFIFLCIIAGFIVGAWRAPVFSKPVQKDNTDAISYSKTWLTKRIKSSLPEEEANLGTSYLLGEKGGLSDSFKDSLRIAGLTHIVVASGAHLSIIVSLVRKLFGKISRRVGLIFAIVFVLIFMGLVGWTPSILRAGIMAILTLTAWYVGRKFEAWRLILITAAITLLINPLFISDLGWQFSFTSYAGIMILGPKLTKYYYGKKKPGFFGSTIITTIAATLLVAPISLYNFGSLSLVSIIANLLILPTLSIAMGLTFLAGIFAGVPFLGVITSFVAGKILRLHIIIIEFIGSKGYFLLEIPKKQPLVFLLYLPIIAILIIAKFKNSWQSSDSPQRWTILRKNAKISKI